MLGEETVACRADEVTKQQDSEETAHKEKKQQHADEKKQ